MSISYSGLTNYGKVTLPSAESWGTNMNILRFCLKPPLRPGNSVCHNTFPTIWVVAISPLLRYFSTLFFKTADDTSKLFCHIRIRIRYGFQFK